MVAQPPFSINELWSHEVETFLNSTSFFEASACASNLATQIGASAATTATSARSFAILSAVLSSVQPSAREADDGDPDSADHCSPQCWFAPRMNLHLFPP